MAVSAGSASVARWNPAGTGCVSGPVAPERQRSRRCPVRCARHSRVFSS